MRKFTLAASAFALALTGIAFAAEQQMGSEGRVTTRIEAQDGAAKLFDRLDLNHDGKLDTADRAVHLGEIFDKIDTNHDGSISREEFIAAHEHMMGHPGMGPGESPPPAPGGQPPADGHGHWHHEGEHMRLMGLTMAILHEADPNHTGSVSKDAFVAAALRLFDKADTNHDGKLTPQERRAAWAAGKRHMMMEWREHHHGMDWGPMGDMPAPLPAGK